MADCHSIVVIPSVNHIVICRASRLSRRWPFRPDDRKDIEQSMRQHLIERCSRLDLERGTVEQFVEAALSNWELQQKRNLIRRKQHCYNQTQPLNAISESELVSRCWRSADAQLEAGELLWLCLKLLTFNERELLRLVSCNGERYAAYWLGITRHEVRQQLAHIKAKCAGFKKNSQNPDRA